MRLLLRRELVRLHEAALLCACEPAEAYAAACPPCRPAAAARLSRCAHQRLLQQDACPARRGFASAALRQSALQDTPRAARDIQWTALVLRPLFGLASRAPPSPTRSIRSRQYLAVRHADHDGDGRLSSCRGAALAARTRGGRVQRRGCRLGAAWVRGWPTLYAVPHAREPLDLLCFFIPLYRAM